VYHVIETSFSAFPFGFFPVNMGAIFDEYRKKGHQDISEIEERLNGKWSRNMLADCCWSLMRETPTGEYKRQKKTK
jgi:hypothetical protein